MKLIYRLVVAAILCLALYARGNDASINATARLSVTGTNTNAVSPNSGEFAGKDFPLLSTKGVLHLSFPDSWEVSSRLNSQAGIPMDLIAFRPRTNDEFAVILEVVKVSREKAKDLDLRKKLTEASNAIATNSVGGRIDIQDLKGKQVTGVYFTATDKRLALVLQPNLGEYRKLTQGYARLDDLVLTFRLVSNTTGEEQQAVLEMIKSARFSEGN
jgi:hypothetical protein